jgi:hypothetical protein
MYDLNLTMTMTLPPRRPAAIARRRAILALLALLLSAASAHAQAKPAAAPKPCTGEIPFGVKVVRLPDAEQKKVTISDFSVSAEKDAMTYDLAMRVKNGSATWCLTSLTIAYVLGDARGQEWAATEYPAVMQFTTQNPAADDKSNDKPGDKPKDAKPKTPPHGVGMPPGKEEKRIVFDLYNYIQPRPMGLFDGFHLISAEIKSCMGYPLAKAP